MSYFTWKETGLTQDCDSLEAMAYRFEESAKLMRKMSNKGFTLQRKNNKQLITHKNPNIFNEWGFINEEPPFRQLAFMPDNGITFAND
ncbi:MULTISPECIES: hypothetical protein [unclassified Prochlorococcus]|uniref:hypothetical protein n=1 Tax=unclassified Prochlorococcus TaxID=2627481 RepID=UPI000533A87C|nr:MULTISPECIES: hypothetical protein [unclassified Prochlorococcus]KGG14503.1 hypothetical protein EV06_1560 [Prochlorococcus sp. MIT 0602]KGG16072.1 hypothetical protein EV07_2040 [Prochlorococcus sp. MIT 0603]